MNYSHRHSSIFSPYLFCILLSFRKKKEKQREKEIVKQVTNASKETEKPKNEMKLTKAELAFMKQQEKMVCIQIFHCSNVQSRV